MVRLDAEIASPLLGRRGDTQPRRPQVALRAAADMTPPLESDGVAEAKEPSPGSRRKASWRSCARLWPRATSTP